MALIVINFIQIHFTRSIFWPSNYVKIIFGQLQTPLRELMTRDQLNSRFHGRDIFLEIGLFSVKNTYFREICDFFVNFDTFTFIYEGFQSFMSSFCADFAVCYYVSDFST